MNACPSGPSTYVKAITPQEDIGGSESDALVAVGQAAVVAERLHQSSRFLRTPWRPPHISIKRCCIR
jgi:hypothetical protein